MHHTTKPGLKMLLFCTVTVCVAAVALFGCSKSDSSSSVLSSSSYSMSAVVTNQAVKTPFSAIGIEYVTALRRGDTCTIMAFDTSGTSVIADFKFIIVGYKGKGNYTMDSYSYGKCYYESLGTAYTQTLFGGCAISITSVAGQNIAGTFSGDLMDGSHISDGKFMARGTGL